MDPALMIELFGYLGSTLVVVSMLMASVVKLRVINTVGSVISATYALIIGSFPLALMNICLIIINVYNLFKLLRTKNNYDTVMSDLDDAFVWYFLDRYSEDIAKYFPGFTLNDLKADMVRMVCCDGDPAGILLGNKMEDASVNIILDYSVPAYRDCSVGRFLYAELKDEGIAQLSFTQPASKDHIAYLMKMGFVQSADGCTKIL